MVASDVEDMCLALQRFGAADYVVFVLMLVCCAAIGVYFGFFSGQMTADDYLMGGRNMRIFPITMSLIASFTSGIALLGLPTEVYLYGTQYIYVGGGMLLMGAAMCFAYLPVLHEMRLTSTYEYLEKRFNKNVRLFVSVMFVIGIISWIPIVIYVPALAFNQATGINVHTTTPVVCLVCIFYTCVGGLKAVVWTDVFQTFMMFGSMILVMIKGTIDLGGPSVVWQRNWDSDRIEAPDFRLDPTKRFAFFVLVFGGFFQWLITSGANQMMLQRYLSLPSLRAARIAVWIFAAGAFAIIIICTYCGMLIYATYYDCDPLTTKLAQAKDQLLPLLVMRTLGDLPGLPGCFLAGIFSAALSSMSTALNSMAAVVLEDFYKTFWPKPLTERQTSILMKSVVLVTGIICVLLVVVIEKLGSVLQMTISLGAITAGPGLGMFSVGLFLPWVNAKGVLFGGVTGLGFMSWIILGAQAAIATGQLHIETKPLTVEGCTYDFVASNITSTDTQSQGEVFVLFRLSYWTYALLGCIITMIMSLPVSFLTGPNDPKSMDHRLLSPIVRRFLDKPNKSAERVTPTDGYKAVELEIISNSVDDRN